MDSEKELKNSLTKDKTQIIAQRVAQDSTGLMVAPSLSERFISFIDLKMDDLTDKTKAQEIHDARMEVKNERLRIEKEVVYLTEESKHYVNGIKDKAKVVYTFMSPIEKHLQSEEDKFEREKQRLKEEKQQADLKKFQERVGKILSVYGAVYNGLNYTVGGISLTDQMIQHADQDTFTKFEERMVLEKGKIDTQRLIDEQAQKDRDQKAEDQRLENERIKAEQDKKDLELKEKEENLAKEKKDWQDLKDKEANDEAERKRLLDVSNKAAQDALDNAEKKRKEDADAERLRQELLPDVQKLQKFSEHVLDNLLAKQPALKNKKAMAIMLRAVKGIEAVVKELDKEIKTLK